jgi:hypothetical protein
MPRTAAKSQRNPQPVGAVVRAARPALAFAAVLGIALASAASAAGPATLTFPDPKGDNTSPGAAQDITGVTFTTSGTGTGRNYVAKNLVITLSLAAAPSTDGTTIYEVAFDQPGCGNVYVSVVPGSIVLDPSYNSAGCGSAADATGSTSTSFAGAPEVKGSSFVWTLPMRSLPAPVTPGMTLSGVNAFTDFIDPAFGSFGPGAVTGPLYDTAATDTSYKVG